MLAFALLAGLVVSAGVQAKSVPHMTIVFAQQQCILRNLNLAPDVKEERRAKLTAAISLCREQLEKSYADGKLRMNGKPFSQSWWREAQTYLDAGAADAEALLALPSTADTKVALKVGDRLMGPGEQFGVLGRVVFTTPQPNGAGGPR
jgi:hypothetical protein